MAHTKLPEKIIVQSKAQGAYISAGKRASRLLDIPFESSDTPEEKALNIGDPTFFAEWETANQTLSAETSNDEYWDMILPADGNTWLVSGCSPWAAAHATLTLVDHLRWDISIPGHSKLIRKQVFRSTTMEFDDWSGGFHRMADGFDMDEHVADAVRVGMQGIEINLLADIAPIQVTERRCDADMYQWWCIYSPALDMFYESELTRGTYPRDYLERNRQKLLQTAELARSWGLKLTFLGFEPRAWPERLYDRYPELRGARVDCSDYSVEAEFAPDPNHPLVLQHYSEMMTQLLQDVPDLDLFSVWSQDSAAGFPWAERLYPGANGPRPPRKKPIEATVATFMSTLRDAGRAINPDLTLTLCLSWFVADEREKIVQKMPDDIDFSLTAQPDHALPKDGKSYWPIFDSLRKLGRYPQTQIMSLSNPWKPFGPHFGFPYPWLVYEILSDAKTQGDVQDLIHRGGIATTAFVPKHINNEILRAFAFEGPDLEINKFVNDIAQSWAGDDKVATSLVAAWKLCDEVVRSYEVLSWTVTLVSGRTLWRRLVKPLVPNQALLSDQEKGYYSNFEFSVGKTDPAWVDNFYKGWGRMLQDDIARNELSVYDEVHLPKLRQAVKLLDDCGTINSGCKDIRDRIMGFYHMLMTERNLIEIQEAIHACLAVNREKPGKVEKHFSRIQRAMKTELENTQQFIGLLDNTESTIFPETSCEETTYMFKAPLTHLLECKIKVMESHFDDTPGPWFDELTQPGGWTSDLSLKDED